MSSLNNYIEKWVREVLPMTIGCQCVFCRAAGWTKHDSDCAVHNMPAYPNGPCNCSRINVSEIGTQPFAE